MAVDSWPVIAGVVTALLGLIGVVVKAYVDKKTVEITSRPSLLEKQGKELERAWNRIDDMGAKIESRDKRLDDIERVAHEQSIRIQLLHEYITTLHDHINQKKPPPPPPPPVYVILPPKEED